MRLWQMLAAQQSDGNTDPNFSDVSLLLHCDGSDGSTSFVDSSNNNFTVTANGNAQIDTAQSKFGGASLLLDGSGDYLSIPNSSEFNFGTGDFTIELWARLNITGSTQGLLYFGNPSATNNSQYAWYLAEGGSGQLLLSTGNDSNVQVNTLGSYGLTDKVWGFIQVVRESGTVKIRLDGTEIASNSDNRAYSTPDASFRLLVGRRQTSIIAYADGHVDDIRITKGVARSNTVPTSAFPDS